MGLKDLLKPVRGMLVVGTALQAVGAVVGLLPMVAIVELVDVLAIRGEPGRAWTWVWVAVGGLALRMVLVGGGVTLNHFADSRFGSELRMGLSRQLARIPIGEAQARSSGEVKRLITDDVAAMHTLVAHAVGDMAVTIVTAVAALVALLLYSWPMALLALVPVLGFVVAFGAMMGKAVSQFDDYDRARTRVNTATVEFARGIAVVKTFGQVGRASSQYHAAVDDYATFFGRWMGPMINASAAGLAIVATPTVLAVMACGGLLFMRLGWTDIIGLAAGLVFGVGLAVPLTQMEAYGVKLRSSREAADRIGSFLSIGPMSVPAEPRAIQGRGVRMRQVSMRYREDGPEVLSRVDLTLEPGTVTALVGPSGAGKSTCASLVPRFWDPTSGEVVVGGTDVRQADASALYDAVGFLLQGKGLVPMSVADNIRLGRPDATRAEVEEAAALANVHDRIMALPHGYDSVIGRDASFSGGEGQRIAVARVLLHDAPVLVLDEATSFADPENEVALQQALAHAARDRDVLVIAHRLSTIAHVDRIIVLEGGRIVESGRHEELLSAGGLYRRLWETQHAPDPGGGAGADDGAAASGSEEGAQ